MNIRKVASLPANGNEPNLDEFDHFVALDWSKSIVAIGHVGRRSKVPTVFERTANINDVRAYLMTLRGRIALTFEETTTAQWLYVELRDVVDRVLVCDPWKNRLVCHGPKTDTIDAGKLCLLLRGGFLTEVFHSTDVLYELRTLVSAYDDVVRAGVRYLDQRHALERGRAETRKNASFIVEHLTGSIEAYRRTKEAYEARFTQFCRRHPQARRLLKIKGLGPIGVVTILAMVVDARRFPTRGHYLAYCGLVWNGKFSGGRSYGRRKPRYCRRLKAVYKTAAMAAINAQPNPIREYYEHLLAEGVAEHNARHAVARYIARVTYGMMKNGTAYDPYLWKTQPDTTVVA